MRNDPSFIDSFSFLLAAADRLVPKGMGSSKPDCSELVSLGLVTLNIMSVSESDELVW